MKTRVLIVDDSALMRAMLAEIISTADDLEVVGTAPDAAAAREAIKTLNPDVMTLDVDMPGIDGLEFLDRLMRMRPMPVVMISSLTDEGSETSLRALELGAVDVIAKPRASQMNTLMQSAEAICDTIRAAHHARPRSAPRAAAAQPPPASAPMDSHVLQQKLVFIGASTGGTEAIKEVLTGFPSQMPGILIVQHMPEMFTGSFAKRLDGLCRIHVKEAEDGERVQPGTAYLAPGHSHLSVRRGAGGFVCELSRAEPVNRHRPSVDVLFHSAAKQVGAQAVGVILTGMGKDGAQGLRAMRDAGAWNIAQDQESCVVWGMPREATVIGAAQEISPLKEVAARVLARLRSNEKKTVGA